jgi:hypothetical protein
MKERGVLPKRLRFQASIPMVNSVLPPRIFPNPDDLGQIRPGYAAATQAEIARGSAIRDGDSAAGVAGKLPFDAVFVDS